jgi:hypothetical protein
MKSSYIAIEGFGPRSRFCIFNRETMCLQNPRDTALRVPINVLFDARSIATFEQILLSNYCCILDVSKFWIIQGCSFTNVSCVVIYN